MNRISPVEAATSTRVDTAVFQRVRATNSPSARHRNGYAGRMYVGSLLPEQLKKNTHHNPASIQKTPASDGRDSPAPSPRSKLRPYATNRIDPGSKPPRRMGT